MKIGNIPPHKKVKVEIAYLQELSLSCSTFYHFQLTGKTAPRYINHIPKEHMKEIQNEGKSLEGDFSWSFKINLRTTRKVVFGESPSHKLSKIS